MTRAKKDNKLDEEIILLVKLFLESNLSDIELSKKTGISSSTVGRRLTNKNKIIELYDKDENKIDGYKNATGEDIYNLIKTRRQENLSKARKKGGVTAYKKQKNSILSELDMDVKSKYNFLALCILTFRLKMTNLEKILNMTEENIMKNLLQYNPQDKEAFIYLFNLDKANQTKSLNAFNIYYNELKKAMQAKDKKKVHELLFIINDNRVINLRGKKNLSIKDVKNIITYQIKYAKDVNDLAELLNVSSKELNQKIKVCLKDNKQLQNGYFNLLNYLRR